MVKFIINAWESKKDYLRNYLSGLKKQDVDSYEKLVKILLKEVLAEDGDGNTLFNPDNLICNNFGSCCGVEIFIFHLDKFEDEMGIGDYFGFDNHYGSCSCCDTLKRILDDLYDDDNLTESSVDKVMTLMLHMIQRIKRFGRED